MGAINHEEVTPSLFWVLISRPLINEMSVFVCVEVHGAFKKDLIDQCLLKGLSASQRQKNVIYGVLLDSFSDKLIRKSSFFLFEGLVQLNWV